MFLNGLQENPVWFFFWVKGSLAKPLKHKYKTPQIAALQIFFHGYIVFLYRQINRLSAFSWYKLLPLYWPLKIHYWSTSSLTFVWGAHIFITHSSFVNTTLCVGNGICIVYTSFIDLNPQPKFVHFLIESGAMSGDSINSWRDPHWFE